MLDFHRIAIATVTMILLCAASVWASVIAQDVFDSPQFVEPPMQADAEAAEEIRKALNDDPDVRGTGDPMLEDVLQIIEQRGSVLDGSSLDPKADESAAENGPGTTTDANDADQAASKTRTAERLLKAARCLEEIQPLDETRRELVNRMRRETVRLLSE